MSGNSPPIVVKRKKVVAGDGHHGGAWKVAYADFVTAMMAFFLLMWLLNATTESQRKGIADYFAPTVPVSPVSGGGSGVMNGDSVLARDTLIRDGPGGAADVEFDEDGDKLSAREGPARDPMDAQAPFETLEEALRGRTGESDFADELLSHIVTRVTDEGLVIDVFARDGKPLFASGSSLPTERMTDLLAMIAEVARLVTNRVAVAGHTDGAPFASGGEDNWTLSADRADASRRALIGAGLESARFARIVGRADRELALPDAPEDPRNRRVTITLLRDPPGG